MTLERYRIWKTDGTYEVITAHNRQQALAEGMRRFNLSESQIKAVGKATSRGRLFKVNQ